MITNSLGNLEFFKPSSVSDVLDYLSKPTHLKLLADGALLVSGSEFLDTWKYAKRRLADRTAEGLKRAVDDLRIHGTSLHQP